VDRRRKLNPRHPELANTLSNLGGAQVAAGQFADAEAALWEAVDLSTEIGGPSIPSRSPPAT
jgi:hypothetical protein